MLLCVEKVHIPLKGRQPCLCSSTGPCCQLLYALGSQKYRNLVFKIGSTFQSVCWLNKPYLWSLGCLAYFYLYVFFLSPSSFGILKTPSSEQYHFYQDEKTLVSLNALNTPTSAPALSMRLFSFLIFRFHCFQSQTECLSPRKPSLDRWIASVLVTLQVLSPHF